LSVSGRVCKTLMKDFPLPWSPKVSSRIWVVDKNFLLPKGTLEHKFNKIFSTFKNFVRQQEFSIRYFCSGIIIKMSFYASGSSSVIVTIGRFPPGSSFSKCCRRGKCTSHIYPLNDFKSTSFCGKMH